MKGRALGTQEAKLIYELNRKGYYIVTIADARAITETTYKTAHWILSDLTKKGWLFRISAGKYLVLPPGIDKSFATNWFIVAREFTDNKNYYLFGYSALALHDMISHPLRTIFTAITNRRIRSKQLSGVNFKFISLKKSKFWGIENIWVSDQEKVCVSNLEKTIVDCAALPQYCGGITEIANGLLRRRAAIDFQRLYNYTRKYNVKAVSKRLGYLLEFFNLGDKDIIKQMKQEASKSPGYVLLDPVLTREGKYLKEWHLLLNIPPGQLKGIGEAP